MKKNYLQLLGNREIAHSGGFLFLLFLGIGIPMNGQETIVSFTSSTSFTVPVGVTSLKVECWGAGGKGSNIANPTTGTGGGGGGGAYASSILCVIPGEIYTLNVGIGGNSTNANGGDTFFGSASTVMAKGGNGLTANVITGATGGSATTSVGTTKYGGGNGGDRSTYAILVSLGYRSGAGGGGAGSTGAGHNANNQTGGASRADNGGSGGAGTDGALLSALAGFNGNPGSNYGGGGAGAGRGLLLSSDTYFGGNGASGIIRITYEAYKCNATLTTTWNGTSWSNGTPDVCKKAIIDGNYNTTTNGSITVCSCQINSGRTLTVGTSNYLEVYNEITNNGTLIVADDGSLKQQYSTISNTGTVKVYRNTTPMYRYDFTYWSSPVSGVALSSLSPNTLFDKYQWWNATTQAWVKSLYGAEVMVGGKGYIIRAPQTYSTNPAIKTVFEGVFEGAPHNGTISYPVSGDNTGQKFNLLGNPYPSAIDAQRFLTANSSVLGGTLYFWTHNSALVSTSTGTYQYLNSDYATYNFSGGTAVGSGPAPGNKIGSGQAFFVSGTANGSAVFTNSMRLLNDNSQFYRSNVDSQESTPERHRFWLNFKSAESSFNQILIGYIENATDSLDWGYDGETMSSNQISLYSLLNQTKLAIQGKGLPFGISDTVPLGYKTVLPGNFIIALADFDGIFVDQDIYLKDNVLQIIHNLKESDYSFVSEIGTFDERFEVVYSDEDPGFETQGANTGYFIAYKNKNAEIVVNASSSIIDEVKVYDISGRLLYREQEVNNKEAILQNFPITQQVLIVEMHTNEGIKVSRKIIH